MSKFQNLLLKDLASASDHEKNSIKENFKNYLQEIGLVNNESSELYNAYINLALQNNIFGGSKGQMKLTSYILTMYMRGLCSPTQAKVFEGVCETFSNCFEHKGIEELPELNDSFLTDEEEKAMNDNILTLRDGKKLSEY